MNNPENLTYSMDKTRLRMGAAVGVLVIAAGFALGSVMHTSSSSANEPTSSVIDNNTAGEEAPDTGNGSNPTSNNVGNEQPAADKGSVNNDTVEPSQDSNETDTSEAEETNATEADETEEAEVTETDETEGEEADDTEDADETDDTEEADDDEGNGLGFDFELVYPVIPDWFMNPLPLPDDLGPPAPGDPINPPNPIDPRVQRYAGLLGRIS